MNVRLKRAVLAALLPCGDEPLPEAALVNAVRLMERDVTQGDVLAAVRLLEQEGYVSGVSDDLFGRNWLLTAKGTHKARQL